MDRKAFLYLSERCLNKVRFESKEDALRSYNGYKSSMQRNRGRIVNKDKHRQHPYKCKYCNGWHLTTTRK